jgi:hypothetical protein
MLRGAASATLGMARRSPPRCWQSCIIHPLDGQHGRSPDATNALSGYGGRFGHSSARLYNITH